jgi:tetratricopeptide (TPR) repeat protein
MRGSLARAQTTQDRRTEALRLTQEGLQLFNRSQFREALEKFQAALVIVREIGERQGEGAILSNIGYLLEAQNQPELAIVFFKQSVNVREAIRDDIKELPQEQQRAEEAEALLARYRERFGEFSKVRANIRGVTGHSMFLLLESMDYRTRLNHPSCLLPNR